MKKRTTLILILLFLFCQLSGQVTGVSRYGAELPSGTDLVNHFGDTLSLPRLNRYGHILFYPPQVSTDSIHIDETDNSVVICFGHTRFDGWSPILQQGFECSLSSSFETPSTHLSSDASSHFHFLLEGLPANQTHYIRAFATNAMGVGYGETLEFHTPAGDISLGDIIIQATTPNSVQFRIPIFNNGGAPISGKVCAVNLENPLAADICDTIYPTTASSITSSLHNLIPNTSYQLIALLTNHHDSDTLSALFHTPTDLVLDIIRLEEATLPCDTIRTYPFVARLTGDDPHKEDFVFTWSASVGSVSARDSTMIISMTERRGYTLTVTVSATSGATALSKQYGGSIDGQILGHVFYVCTNEFLNTAEITQRAIDSIAWEDQYGTVVSHDEMVQLPTGDYTIYYTDQRKCTRSQDVHIGKIPLACTSINEPSANESARQVGDTWLIDSISDIDGNWYAVVQIGDQCWMRQNLRTQTSPLTGNDLSMTSYNTYEPQLMYKSGIIPDKVAYYGALYNWGAAFNMSRTYDPYVSLPNSYPCQGICPDGWHIPRYAEWEELFTTIVHQFAPDITISPPYTQLTGSLGTNTPLFELAWDLCYEEVHYPEYPKEYYNASHLSIIGCSVAPRTETAMFWTSETSYENIGRTIALSQNRDVYKNTLAKNGFIYVRCARNN